MFCTNCGEEMRDTDKFCAACGTPASSRPAKKRSEPEPQPGATVTPPPQTAPSQPVRIPQSTAEAFNTPVRRASISAPENKREERQPERPPEPAPAPSRSADPWNASSEEEQRRSLIEAEEIASARGLMPIEALPDLFPPPTPKLATRPVAATVTCPTCGKLNPETNAFCESCGRKLSSPQSGSAETPADTSPGWLYDAQPTAAPAPAPVAFPGRTPTPSDTAPVAQPAPMIQASSAGTTSASTRPAVQPGAGGSGDSFSYYYNDKAGQAGNKTLLYVLLAVLALGILGVFYLMLRPSPKGASATNVSVRIAPVQAQVAPGNAFDFAATVTGTGNTDVNWSMQEGSAGGKLVNRGAQAQNGEVSNMAVYVAPSTPGTYHVLAASKADPAKIATAEVRVEPK